MGFQKEKVFSSPQLFALISVKTSVGGCKLCLVSGDLLCLSRSVTKWTISGFGEQISVFCCFVFSQGITLAVFFAIWQQFGGREGPGLVSFLDNPLENLEGRPSNKLSYKSSFFFFFCNSLCFSVCMFYF